jgi:hypothetical protein
MSEFYLVLSGEQREIETLEEAKAVREGLARHMPDKVFKVYRCKTSMRPARHFEKAVELLCDIQRGGLTRAHIDRLDVLLTTIGNRTPKFKTLTTPAAPLPLVDYGAGE